jgi:predicted ABC-class ATPase
MGGSGDYFSLADRVVMMDNYQPVDVTSKAHQLAQSDAVPESGIADLLQNSARIPVVDCLSATGATGKPRIRAFGTRLLQFGVEEVPLKALDQLVDTAQLLAIGYLIEKYHQDDSLQDTDMVVGLERVLGQMRQGGFDTITPYPMGKLALPRLQELVAVVNRMRLLKLEPVAS